MTKARFLCILFIFCGAAIALLMALMIDVALPSTSVFAQTAKDESAEPPAGWSSEQKQFWLNERKACIALFKDTERRQKMTADQLAKLPKMSPVESRTRVEKEHGCMSMFPARRATNLIRPPATERTGAPLATPLPTPLPSTGPEGSNQIDEFDRERRVLAIAFPLKSASAQAPGEGIPEKAPTGWDQQFWTNERNACIALFRDFARFQSMTPQQLAQLPKLSDRQFQERTSQLKLLHEYGAPAV